MRRVLRTILRMDFKCYPHEMQVLVRPAAQVRSDRELDDFKVQIQEVLFGDVPKCWCVY